MTGRTNRKTGADPGRPSRPAAMWRARYGPRRGTRVVPSLLLFGMSAYGVRATEHHTFRLGGDLPVHRLGFGAMRITGPGVWGPPPDKAKALAALRRAVDLGVDLIDTAESYGPHVSEELIAEALYPYPRNLVIATKGG